MRFLQAQAFLASIVSAEIAADVELMSRSKILAAKLQAMNDTIPQQLHLSLTGDTSQMQLMFVTNWVCTGNVSYAALSSPGSVTTVEAAPSTYTAGIGGWNGTIHTAVLADLAPGSSYNYTACCDGNCAQSQTFAQPPVPTADSDLYTCVTADMGTVQLFGWMVADRIIK